MNRGRKPRVAVIGTGGTIAGIGRHSLDLYERRTGLGVIQSFATMPYRNIVVRRVKCLIS